MNNIPIFDGHNDTLTRLDLLDEHPSRSFFDRSDQGHLDLPRAKEANFIGGIFAIFTPPPEGSQERDPYYGLTFSANGYEVLPRSPLEYRYAREFSTAILEKYHQLEQRAAGQVGLVHTYQDLLHNLEQGILSVVLHLEGAEAIQPDLSDLETYYSQGVRSLGIVWSRPNAFGEGVPFRFPHSPDTGPGLSTAGKNLVRSCNRLGILIDLAHLNEQGFWDAARITDAPLVVSHTGVHEICPSTRNLTDRQIDAVGASDGLIGIMFDPTNIRPDGQPQPDTPLTEIVRHIGYIAGRIGVDHVAFGSDFDGADMPQALKDVTGLPKLIQALQENGFDRESIEKIAYQNWFRVLRQI